MFIYPPTEASPGVPGCIQNQSSLNRRPDVLSYASAALWVSSDAADTDFTAKLIDVYPGSTALNIADLGSTSNLFAAGHRIRVDISSSTMRFIMRPGGRLT
jgi:predicted acyl esterase